MKNFTLYSMKRAIAISALVIFSMVVFGQMPAAITISPSNATANDSITLTFDPSKACFQNATLVGASIIYMHSGVTIGGTDWSYVITADSPTGGADGTPTTLLPNGDGTYSKKYLPSAYYGFPAGSVVTRLCAVFNGGDWNHDGRDFKADLTCGDFFIPLHYAQTAPTFEFTVNMQKAMNDGIFDPASGDVVYTVLEGNDTVAMTTLGGTTPNKFAATINTGIDSGVVYNYKFRINQNTYETVERQITGTPGTTAVENWWNDVPIIPPAIVTFQVDMQYQVAKGTFNPATDSVDIAGTMNSWGGSAYMTRVPGNVCTYEISYTFDTTAVKIQEYKYRINKDWATSEFPNGGANRMMWVPGTAKTILNVYDNYKPGTVPMTFKCHMLYQINAGHFDPAIDYLDVAGGMNGWGAYDVLFDRGHDSIYVINMNIDTGYIHNGLPVEFKFRFNGDWSTAEFPNGSNRSYSIQDTTGGVQNLVDVWYNDLNPGIATPPWAYDLAITGNLSVTSVVTGTYTYEDVNYLPEGASTYKWYRADSISQATPEEITGATAVTYTLAAADANKYIAFEVTPIAQGPGDSLVGKAVKGWSAAKVAGVGIPANNSYNVKFYPNPVTDVLYFDNLENIQKIEIYSVIGQHVYVTETKNMTKISMNTSNLKSGVYFIKFYTNDKNYTTAKFVKN
ncbi:MAG: T9SS type A sorting domain-containing protein [Bacteroidetes bacterium]|nr:T9SS type A sorting domain-containing protein [Bacteroidota bacterium]